MNANVPSLISVLIAFPLMLSAQLTRQHDPTRLTNWPAPLYWQPGQAEQGTLNAALATVTSQAATTTFTPVGTLVFVAITPCRVVDTRTNQGFTGAFGPPSIAAGFPVRTIPIQSSTCSIPSVAQAYSLNVTVVPQGPLAWLTLYPATAGSQPAPPNASTLNAPAGNIVANAAILAAGTDGQGSVDVYASNPTDLIIDINGYYTSPTRSSFAQGVTNTVLGYGALQNEGTGFDNTALGAGALASDSTGSGNTAVGSGALALTNGPIGVAQHNVGLGMWAGYNITTGAQNTAIGDDSMFTGLTNAPSITGNWNIALGFSAGASLRSGSNNIDIGSFGAPTDSGVIRIGFINGGNANSTFIDGISGVNVGSGANVVVSPTGQLGIVLSSRRYKEDIRDMGEASTNLMQLRPVTYRYKQPYADGSKPLDYGLIAEEVARIYPDLVVKGSDGQVETVQYQKLAPMLLNELQKQHTELTRQSEENRFLREQIAQQQESSRQLEARFAALEEILRSGK